MEDSPVRSAGFEAFGHRFVACFLAFGRAACWSRGAGDDHAGEDRGCGEYEETELHDGLAGR